MMSKSWKLYTAASVAGVLVGLGSPVSAEEVTFAWVTVGNCGNAPDPLNEGEVPDIGSLAYEYLIAEHEVTNAQYAEFLNAVAAEDPNDLYHTAMESDLRGGIIQSDSSDSFTYSVKECMGDKPVNYVSFFDAMRFVNWLHNGQPSGPQDPSTTENGVYDISDGLSETRADVARFFIPTENEWYKAAYHQPSAEGGDTDDYWFYPTATNSIPTIATALECGDIGNPGCNVVNYSQGTDWNGQDGNVTTVGSAGACSESFYGTFDQGGNVTEWNETLIGSHRGLRGGSWFNVGDGTLRSSDRSHSFPEHERDHFGFRIASAVCSADLDRDGDVDLTDFGLFQIQFTGPQ